MNEGHLEGMAAELGRTPPRFETVSCMESPADPGLRELYFKAKASLIDEANELNAALPDSDGIRGDVGIHGNTVSVRLTVPVEWGKDRKPKRVTYIESLARARVNVKWPERVV